MTTKKYVKGVTTSISSSTKTPFTEANYTPKQIKDVERVSSFTTTEEYMKASGIKIRGMFVDLSCLQTATPIKESIKVAKLTVKVFTLGRMAKFMMDNSLKDKKKAMVFGTGSKVTPIWAHGSLIGLKVMACTPGSMETVTRANGSNAFVMAREPTSSKMVTSMSENMQMVFLRVKANTNGQTVITTQVNLKPA